MCIALDWTIDDPLDKPCPHRTPNAGGSVASELHGVCIFCWRDRASVCQRAALLWRVRLDELKASKPNRPDLLSLLDRALTVITFAVHEFGGGYNNDGTPKGEAGSWDGITQLMEDLEVALSLEDAYVPEL